MKKIIVLISTLFVSSLALASASPSKSDGCGLGWQVMDGHTFLATTVRGTTNAFVPPTFGMTSGTIGCEQHDIAANDIEKATYAVTNFETLKVEMAMGQGETLQGFAQIMGCDAQNFSEMTQQNFNNIYSSSETSAIEMFQNIKTLTAGQCSAA